MPVGEELLEVRDHEKEGYSSVIGYGGWLVALMNYADEFRAEKLTTMQRHEETDEVFVLLKGRCILFLGEGDRQVTEIHGEDMQQFKLYNVKKNAWHTHTLSEDAKVLIVENSDTTPENSPRCPLTNAQRERIVGLTRALWAR